MKKALCTGINNYPDPNNNLNGCINDATAWKNLLDNLGFETTLLIDSQVTVATVLNWIKQSVIDAKAGDSIVYTNSSHGTYVIDYSNDEIDGYDEALYLYDDVLLDDQVKEALMGLEDGVKFTFITDSCFSGTMTKSKFGRKGTSTYKKARFVISDPKTIGLPKKKSFLKGLMKEVLLSGCSDSEYSYDAYIDGDYHGAFSYFAIKSYTEGDTYQEWYDKLRMYLPTEYYPQTPQLEGSDFSIRALDYKIEYQEEPDIITEEDIIEEDLLLELEEPDVEEVIDEDPFEEVIDEDPFEEPVAEELLEEENDIEEESFEEENDIETIEESIDDNSLEHPSNYTSIGFWIAIGFIIILCIGALISLFF